MHPTRRSYLARARAVGGSQDLRRGVLMLVAPRAWSGVAVDALRGRRREPAASRQRLSCARWSNAGRSCDFERKTSRSFASWSSRGSSATRARAPVFEPFGRPTRNQRAGCMDRNGRRSCSRAAGGCRPAPSSLVRSTAADLHQTPGLEHPDAIAQVREAADRLGSGRASVPGTVVRNDGFREVSRRREPSSSATRGAPCGRAESSAARLRELREA
jgi:hypothetical protein